MICAPFGRDAELSAGVLQRAGLESFICKNIDEVVRELAVGAGALLTVEDVVIRGRCAALEEFIARQPTWSDLPVLVLTRVANDSHWNNDAYQRLRNLTLLESPIRPSTLISAARGAVRARERQYEVFEADRRKDEFLAMLGHELRNPLAPIGAAAQLLSLSAENPDKVRSTSQIIARQVKHMTSLIDDLLDVARVTRGLITLDRELISVNQILADAAEQVDPMLRARQHELELKLAADPFTVEGDRKRLVQVFANVLQNAVKYTPNGGKIVVTSEVGETEGAVHIADNGIGMTQDMVDHVFDLFAQAERSADRSQGGLGLGLSIVESLVRSHGGSVAAHSDGLGQGSTFTIRLPLHRQTDQAPAASASVVANAAASGSLRVLVVDDNQDAADTLAMLMEAGGYEVSVHYTARDALAAAQESLPHICLLDIGLPDMNGNELARELRKLPGASSAVLVAITGYGQQEDRDSSRRAGFDHHFVKPVDVEELMRVLAGAVVSSAQKMQH
ncbi:ATP-binding protein [Herbaspirillum sp. LeCh32-8]|uniref:ATP-binding response regulator n=1 Tax=Herbaspirillum sp. LeCh32-8 TaxID=2821356 RepID=UPI001FD73965|nr:ATP-binding protein [Herbaspirillum sp. LeCh32-8]